MKKQIYKVLLFAGLLFSGLTGCTDDFEDTNTDPNKLYDTDFKYIFPGTIYKTLKFFGDANYNDLLNNSRLVTVQFKTAPSENTSDGYFKQVYVEILRDLRATESDYEGKIGHENRLAMIKTWKAYVYYMLASMYGPIPMSDALLDVGETKGSFKYDSEKEVYTQILDLLKSASELYNPGSLYAVDKLKPDLVFGTAESDIVKWQKFTNTLRLNIAMHVQNIDVELAGRHAREAMEREELLISSNDDNVAPKWGTDKSNDVSYYYTRFLKGIETDGTWNAYIYPTLSEYYALYLFSYKDPRIEAQFIQSNEGASPIDLPFQFTDTITRPHICNKKDPNICKDYDSHQADGLNEYRRDSVLVDFSVPYVPITESQRIPSDWVIKIIPGTDNSRYPDPLQTSNRFNVSRVKLDFIKTDAKVVLLNYADACFLKAEAKIKFGLGTKSAKDYYEEGIEASFIQYGMGGKVKDYLKQPGIAWDTDGKGFYDKMGFYNANINGHGNDENHLEQIYKQRVFGCFFNGLEGWNVERRARAFRFPPVFNSDENIEGMTSRVYSFGRERINYPLIELTNNKQEYYKGIQLLQDASPNGNSGARWGDNIITSLAFSKVDPQLAGAESKYGGYREIVYHAHYFCHYWGMTYEELVAKAKEMTGETNENRALIKAFNYKYRSFLSTYMAEEPPVTEP